MVLPSAFVDLVTKVDARRRPQRLAGLRPGRIVRFLRNFPKFSTKIIEIVTIGVCGDL